MSLKSSSVSISILMPVHNWQPYLEQAIESILSQTFKNFELIVVCNGDAVDLFDLVKNRWGGDIRVKVFYTPLPGLVFALNYGLHESKGKLIARMDSDDIALPERLSESLSFFCGDSPVDILSTGIELIDEFGLVTGRFNTLDMDNEHVRKELPVKSLLPHPTVIVRRSLLIQVGGYAYGQYSEDYDLWLRVRRMTDAHFFHLGKPLLQYRVHPDQATSKDKLSTIWKYDIALRLRELLLSGDLRFLYGIAFATAAELIRGIKRLVRWH
jgi:glycosyltransferase involved in cell wall biosynthesis